MNINYHESVNFGDALAPWLWEKITGDIPHLGTTLPNTMITGSILADAKENTTVWGAGLGSFKEVVPQCDLRAVRGPLTGMKARAVGLKCDTFGDPALLLPRFYDPSPPRKHKIGIIPHFVDTYAAHQYFREEKIINILDSTEKVINEILSCNTIVSSCLHGLIVAEAYGIPTQHITFGDTLAGDGFKFFDYYLSIGQIPKEPVRYDGELKPSRKKLDIDLDKLMDNCPLK